MRGKRIELPFPHKVLWPNGRTRNVGYRNSVFQKHKEWAWGLALAGKLVAPDGRVPILLIFHPKRRGPEPDKDNCMASAKAYLDGIALAMGVDDRLFDPRVEIGPRGGKIIVEIGA